MSKWGHAMRAAGFGLAAYACASASQSAAADLDLPFLNNDPTPQTKVEFGSGWYIRGDAGGVFDKGPQLSPDLSYITDQTKINWSADLGAGYKFNNWFRGDLTLGMFSHENAKSTQSILCYSEIRNVFDPANPGTSTGVWAVPNQCNALQNASLQKYLLLTNAYFDLGTWYGVTPYVGAGVGAAIIQASGNYNVVNASDGSPYRANLVIPSGSNPTFLQGPALVNPQIPPPSINYGVQNWDRTYRVTKYNFAWALMAGFGYSLTENATIDIGYRYVNMGQFISMNGISTNLSTQEVRIGIRYLVD